MLKMWDVFFFIVALKYNVLLCIKDPYLFIKELNPELFSPEPVKEGVETTEETHVDQDDLLPESLRGSATAVWNTIKDLHLELTLMYHRVCLKLEQMGPGDDFIVKAFLFINDLENQRIKMI